MPEQSSPGRAHTKEPNRMTCPDCNGTGRDAEGERCAHQCPETEPEPACGACEDTGRDLAGYCDCSAGDARRMRDQEDADQSAEDRARDR